MKKAIATLLVLCMCVGLCACGNTVTEDTPPTPEELEAMYLQAKAHEDNARFDEAIILYRSLYAYGFADPDYSGKSPEEVLEIREHNFVLQTISCTYFQYAKSLFNDEIVNRLKDPNSLQIHSLTLKGDSNYRGRFYVVFDYGAANSFGGMVRDTFSAPYTLKDDEGARIIGCSGNPSVIAAQYLVGNYYWCTIQKDSQKEAILNGTATYRGAEMKEYEVATATSGFATGTTAAIF